MAGKGKGMLVLLMVRSKSGEKTSRGKGSLPCYLQGFSYISGGCFGFLPSINLIWTWCVFFGLMFETLTSRNVLIERICF